MNFLRFRLRLGLLKFFPNKFVFFIYQTHLFEIVFKLIDILLQAHVLLVIFVQSSEVQGGHFVKVDIGIWLWKLRCIVIEDEAVFLQFRDDLGRSLLL